MYRVSEVPEENRVVETLDYPVLIFPQPRRTLPEFLKVSKLDLHGVSLDGALDQGLLDLGRQSARLIEAEENLPDSRDGLLDGDLTDLDTTIESQVSQFANQFADRLSADGAVHAI